MITCHSPKKKKKKANNELDLLSKVMGLIGGTSPVASEVYREWKNDEYKIERNQNISSWNIYAVKITDIHKHSQTFNLVESLSKHLLFHYFTSASLNLLNGKMIFSYNLHKDQCVMIKISNTDFIILLFWRHDKEADLI